MIIAVICFALGILGILSPQIIQFIFGNALSFSITGYIQKIVIFLVSLGVALIVHRYINFDILKPLRLLKMGFGSLCVTIGVFFALVLIFV